MRYFNHTHPEKRIIVEITSVSVCWLVFVVFLRKVSVDSDKIWHHRSKKYFYRFESILVHRMAEWTDRSYPDGKFQR